MNDVHNQIIIHPNFEKLDYSIIFTYNAMKSGCINNPQSNKWVRWLWAKLHWNWELKFEQYNKKEI